MTSFVELTNNTVLNDQSREDMADSTPARDELVLRDLWRDLTQADSSSPELLLEGLYNRIKTGVIRDRTQLSYFLNQTENLINSAIDELLNNIVHHERFQALEATWLGLLHLVLTKADYTTEVSIKVKLYNCNWQALSRDLNRAIEYDQSLLFQRVYSDEFDTPGGEPFGVLIGDYYISHKPRAGSNDVNVLSEIGKVCTSALCPFVSSAEASLFGVNNITEISSTTDYVSLFEQVEYSQWRRLRASEQARFLAIVVPRVLMRQPYKNDGSRREQHKFSESGQQKEKSYLWGNSAYAFASTLIRAFANTGWFADIRGGVHDFGEGGVVRNLEYSALPTDLHGGFTRSATDVQIDDMLERELSNCGFIPLSSQHSNDKSTFYSNATLHDPAEHSSDIAYANARMSSMMQYMLCVSRFGHYLKVIGRDKIGSVVSAADCQRLFQNWLNQYTTASDGVNSSIKARYPLAESRVEIKERAGRPGYFTCVIHLKPHFQLDQLMTSIKLVTELSLGRIGSEF